MKQISDCQGLEVTGERREILGVILIVEEVIWSYAFAKTHSHVYEKKKKKKENVNVCKLYLNKLNFKKVLIAGKMIANYHRANINLNIWANKDNSSVTWKFVWSQNEITIINHLTNILFN